MRKKYIQEKMVNWYQPKMLLNVGLKAIISGTFGNYADRRELEAALDTNISNEKDWLELKNEYCSGNEIWVDILGDTGDGFNSTFTIAKSVAKKTLELEYVDDKGVLQKEITQRGKILIISGDEVYPFPTLSAYTNKFKIPFAAAADSPEEIKQEKERPHLYAIPGNHDWYDGLGNFIKLFCQQRWIGIWSTKQHRSYFALPLPDNYWIWATDIQLNSDLDTPQQQYFCSVAREKMKEGDKIILVTAEPAWVYKEMHKTDFSYNRLTFFIDNYIHNKDNRTGKSFNLAATITGDLHHYARYCNQDNPQGHQYITAGGGGAFVHLTHNLPPTLETIKEKNISLQKTFPEKKESLNLLLKNFAFPFMNLGFTTLLFFLYLLFFWLLRSGEPGYYGTVSGAYPPVLNFTKHLTNILLYRPAITLLTVGLAFGFYAFADTNVQSKAAKGIGIIHGLVQVIAIHLILYFLFKFVVYGGHAWGLNLVIVVMTCIVASLFGGFIMGTYLYCTSRLVGMHINEASSSLASPDYKNFLRLHVHDKGVTIYSVGIKKVPRDWKQHCHEEEDPYSFTGSEIKTFLIEQPITILNEKL